MIFTYSATRGTNIPVWVTAEHLAESLIVYECSCEDAQKKPIWYAIRYLRGNRRIGQHFGEHYQTHMGLLRQVRRWYLDLT